jgi:uncharacterized membrane protein
MKSQNTHRVLFDAAEIEMALKIARKKKIYIFSNHPTVTVDFASSLCASPFSLYATL